MDINKAILARLQASGAGAMDIKDVSRADFRELCKLFKIDVSDA